MVRKKIKSDEYFIPVVLHPMPMMQTMELRLLQKVLLRIDQMLVNRIVDSYLVYYSL